MSNKYFEWLSNQVCDGVYSGGISFGKLLAYLYEKDFRYTVLRDENRAEDGIDLRYRFENWYGGQVLTDAEIHGPCSVLEMMVALAIRCESTIMDDPHIGDRTKQWFWRMVTNLGLGSMYDSRFDEEYVDSVVERFLDREYDPDGTGGLFIIRDCEYDLRYIEIWNQLLWYLDSIM